MSRLGWPLGLSLAPLLALPSLRCWPIPTARASDIPHQRAGWGGPQCLSFAKPAQSAQPAFPSRREDASRTGPRHGADWGSRCAWTSPSCFDGPVGVAKPSESFREGPVCECERDVQLKEICIRGTYASARRLGTFVA